MAEPARSSFRWAVRGLRDLADYWTELAGDHALSVADRLDHDAYTADLAARDTARSAAIVAQGWALLANELLDIAAGFALAPGDRLVVSAPFEVTTDVRPCALSLAGAMQPVFDTRRYQIPPLDTDRVRFVPAVLESGVGGFQLAVRARGLRGTTYAGEVVVTDPAAAREVEPRIAVDIQIP
jgi:hypothetical protein